jgi:hypothetical protein
MGRRGKGKLPQLSGPPETARPTLKYSKSIILRASRKTGRLGTVAHDTQHKRPRSPSCTPGDNFLAPEEGGAGLDSEIDITRKKPRTKNKEKVKTIGVAFFLSEIL